MRSTHRTHTAKRQVFLPRDEGVRNKAKCIMERVAAKLGHDSLTWRSVPTNNASLGASAVAVEPHIEQWFLSAHGVKEELDTEQQVRWVCGAPRRGVWGEHAGASVLVAAALAARRVRAVRMPCAPCF
jgi:glutamate synthase domain-containing protein 1